MQLNVRKYLLDISVSIDSIYDYLGSDKNFNTFESSKLLRRAVERELEIIGEATNRILKIDPDIELFDARRIVSLRNWVIHSYDNVDNIIIWGIIIKDLPLLKMQVDKLLKIEN
ncbi:HepT-like ribonuclease domain-containing protein [Mongoliibacter ruber]|uniref:Uncharacterized protein with HEPN domain n=1 Tax=Mongoliibacter ruber TaxID=1750599 RepID=A0A2T0WR59_9BACT|nr:HepT-like ribonuclease domain-containing protein [Mongoliibacter ruber]PRY89189.1 uncharacterized protein with HEPN domain [Mongoliibacter ruber]